MTAALAGLLAVAVGLAWLRLVMRHFRTPTAGRDRPWRLAGLLALQPLTAALLYLTMVPPPASTARGTLVVATRGAPIGAALGGDRVVALPEAPAIPGAERVPDLATALRREGAARLRVVGDGLVARDRDAARGLAVAFALPPVPTGLVRLDPPRAVATGGAFRVGGRVHGVAGATVELVDPAGRRVDVAVPNAAGDFVVAAAARAAGPASFTLRIRGGTRLVATAEVPVWTTADPPPRVLLLAGAPGPEVKYLRRWASDAGLAVHSEVATGAGLALGDAPLPLTAATLRPFDLAVVDGRSWAALSPGARAAVLDAVYDGLGLLVRIDGPLSPPARAALSPLGFAVSGGSDAAPVVLAGPSEDAAARAARAGPGTGDDPVSGDAGSGALPLLTRWTVRIAASDATALLRDTRGAPVALWRAAGRGRVALWPLANSYALVLAGRGDRYGELWSSAFAIIGRGRGGVAPAVSDARVGERVALCGLGRDAAVTDPAGHATTVLVDPATGPAACAAFWPRVAGWHTLHGAGGVKTPFFVTPTDALPGVRAMADRAATLTLAATPVNTTHTAIGTIPGRSWPWFLGWLATSAALWWFERAQFGRAKHQ